MRKDDPPVASLSIELFQKNICGHLPFLGNRPKPMFFAEPTNTAYSRPQQLAHPQQAEGCVWVVLYWRFRKRPRFRALAQNLKRTTNKIVHKKSKRGTRYSTFP